MKTSHFTAGCFTEKFHENPSIPPQHWWLRGTLFHLDRCQLLPSPGEFYPGSFFCRFFSAGKKNQVPDLQSIESCSKPLTGLVFSQKKMRRLISAWVKFFLEGLDFGKEPFLGAVFISKNQWDPMATSSWSFDPATSCGQLALEYIIYILYIHPIGHWINNTITRIP